MVNLRLCASQAERWHNPDGAPRQLPPLAPARLFDTLSGGQI